MTEYLIAISKCSEQGTEVQVFEYVVNEKDNSDGFSANFVIEWYENKKLDLQFQAVMIGSLGNKSFSFSTEGLQIE